jgi:hypothetical protein
MLLMARNTPGAPDFDPFDLLDRKTVGDVTFLGWSSDQAAPPSPQFVSALAQLGVSPPPTGPDAGAAATSGPAPTGPVAADAAVTSLPGSYTAALAAAFAMLQGMQNSDTANVALDASHMAQLQVTWLV